MKIKICTLAQNNKKLAYCAVQIEQDGFISEPYAGWIALSKNGTKGKVIDTSFTNASEKISTWIDDDGKEQQSTWLILS